jgi:cardiolipin synthase (CMP-forming)
MLTSTPNLLTIGRVAVIPLIVLCFYFPGDLARWAACALFTAAATTDYLDGYLARAWRQQSPFGRWLDPIADKLLVAATILMLAGFDRAPLLPSLVILLREITVSGLREYMAEVSVGLPVSRLAKWKTAVQMVAIGVLLVGEAGPGWLPVRGIGEVGLWLAAALTLVTGWDYLRAGVRHMLRADQQRPRPAAQVAAAAAAADPGVTR